MECKTTYNTKMTKTAKEFIRKLHRLYLSNPIKDDIFTVRHEYKSDIEAQEAYKGLQCLREIHVSQTNRYGKYCAEWDSYLVTFISLDEFVVTVDISKNALLFLFSYMTPEFMDNNNLWGLLFGANDECVVIPHET